MNNYYQEAILISELKYLFEKELQNSLNQWQSITETRNTIDISSPHISKCMMDNLFTFNESAINKDFNSKCFYQLHKKINKKKRSISKHPKDVVYLPGKKKKTRQCSQIHGLLAGFNTFHFLSFINGVITLVLNINNNINNNNNNNNLNDNNVQANNNLNSNTNTNNANQVSFVFIINLKYKILMFKMLTNIAFSF